MKVTRNIDLKICIGISLLGILITYYFWSFVNGGNHWELFGTKTEKFLMKYGDLFIVLFSGIIVVPLLLKRDKKRFIIALLSVPVFIYLSFSLSVFLD